MTNVTAGLGLGQSEQWEALIAARRQVAVGYDRRLAGTAVSRRPVAPWAREACWLYTVTHPERDRIVSRLQARGIDARAVWHPAPELPPYQRYAVGSYPVAERISRTACWLPTWAFMDEELLDRVAHSVAEATTLGSAG
jgi:dTDP-4-amino-4,6-dideoxygalactose transaminase